ncbi:hypothetical protein BDU57DRAFT_511164 [Ampelomyces quisqualis]|uniref:DUF1279 domain-containing protein n=1 Tax=Ampelomyces quisqualis TaxID=50730 RepID=A0A6A5R3Q2_AMPQU|nr:hypothetical protein BDU57DRAFT_511164 [Ampelomyces quisqualis]
MKTRTARICSEQLLFTPRPAARPPTPLLRAFFTATHPAACARPAPTSLLRGRLLLLRYQPAALARRFRSSLRFKSTKAPPQRPDPTPHLGSPEPALSLSQRLKQLSREYGWTAVGVYFALSVLDFPFCFLAVRLLGTDRIGHYEHAIKNAFWSVVRLAFPDAGAKSTAMSDDIAEATAREGDMGAADIAVKSSADASIWTQLGLAYLVHKSFIFVRVPFTAAILPKVVKSLRSWGYNIGKKKPKKT